MIEEGARAVRGLARLIEMDLEAVIFYDAALEHLDDEVVRNRFLVHRADHSSRVDTLTGWIGELGFHTAALEADPSDSPAGILESLRMTSGTAEVVKAMRRAEAHHNRRFAEAADWNVAVEMKAALGSYDARERAQLAWIDDWLEQKNVA
jgi:hypothetical protein